MPGIWLTVPQRKKTKMKPGTKKVCWDEDMDWLLLAFTKRGMSFKSTASALSVTVGFEVSRDAVRWRLREKYGFAGRTYGIGVAALQSAA